MKTSLLAVASLSLFATPSPAADDWYALEGGTRSFAGDDVVNTFTNSGTLVVYEATTVRALFVSGGGGGGSGVGGGGGGGGVVEIAELGLQPGTYTITVGAGGLGAPDASSSASNGGNTTMTDSNGTAVTPALPALGGGAGGGREWMYCAASAAVQSLHRMTRSTLPPPMPAPWSYQMFRSGSMWSEASRSLRKGE